MEDAMDAAEIDHNNERRRQVRRCLKRCRGWSPQDRERVLTDGAFEFLHSMAAWKGAWTSRQKLWLIDILWRLHLEDEVYLENDILPRLPEATDADWKRRYINRINGKPTPWPPKDG